MATTKATTTRTNHTATVHTKATSKAGSVKADASVDLKRVAKPFYAYVGVADLAVERLRKLPDAYIARVNGAQEQVDNARGSVKTLPNAVREQLSNLPEKARDTYIDLVKRGEKLVKTVRDNPNTKAAVRQAKTARSQAKGAATSARHSVASVEKAAEDTAAKTG